MTLTCHLPTACQFTRQLLLTNESEEKINEFPIYIEVTLELKQV